MSLIADYAHLRQSTGLGTRTQYGEFARKVPRKVLVMTPRRRRRKKCTVEESKEPCIVCGEALCDPAFRVPGILGATRHVCPPRITGAKEAANKKAEEPWLVPPSYRQRLHDGMAVMEMMRDGEGTDRIRFEYQICQRNRLSRRTGLDRIYKKGIA